VRRQRVPRRARSIANAFSRCVSRFPSDGIWRAHLRARRLPPGHRSRTRFAADTFTEIVHNDVVKTRFLLGARCDCAVFRVNPVKHLNELKDANPNAVSSSNSRATPSSSVSPSSSVPPGMDHSPRNGSLPRRIKSARPRSMITPPIPTTGLSGYSLEAAIREVLVDTARCRSKQPHRARELTSYSAVYNTLPQWWRTASYRHFANNSTEDGAVIRCPECSAEIDVDEDEVEEGEILSLS